MNDTSIARSDTPNITFSKVSHLQYIAHHIRQTNKQTNNNDLFEKDGGTKNYKD